MKKKSLNLKTRTVFKKTISFITAIVMVITLIPLQPTTAYAEEQDTTVWTDHVHNEECGYVASAANYQAEPEQGVSVYSSTANTSSPVYYDDGTKKLVLAMGHPVTIEAGTSGGTAVWYMDGDTPKYINPNGAQGDDLSEFDIVGGGNESSGYTYSTGTTSITMKGGTVNAIIGGNFSGDFTGNVYIDLQGGTIEANRTNHVPVMGGCYGDDFKGQTVVIVRSGMSGANDIRGDDSSISSRYVTSYGIFEKNVYYSYFDNVLIKQDSEWKVTGNLLVPENYTLTIGQNETITIGANTSVENKGTIVNNGTIYLNKPLDFTISGGNGSIVRNAAYIQTTDTSQPTVWVNGTQITSPKTEYTDGKWFIYGLSGNVKVTVGGQNYYGVVTAGTPFELTTNYTVPTEISGIGNLLYVGSVLELNAVYSPAETTFPQTVSYSIKNAGTTNAVINGNVLTATAAGTVILTVTVKDEYNTLSKDFIVDVKLTDAVDISKGDIVIEETGGKLVVTSPFYAGGKKEFALSDAIKITGTTEQYTVTVKSGNSNIILENCSITTVAEKSPFSIESGSKVVLSLSGTNSLTANNNRYAGLRVPEGAEFNIYGPGKLTAQVQYEYGSNAAGIGGNDGESAGKIVINSGEVTAVAYYGAAIGGGYSGSAGNITISGGTVNANSTGNGAAIGSGSNYEEDGGDITITSGTVTAISKDGAGIGSGYAGNIENVTISGGTVTADGDVGIGSATWGKVGTITISGGVITANKDGDSSVSAGIGCSVNASCEAIVISGGRIYASGGGGKGAGIGSGYMLNNSVEIPITISGGTIVAEGGSSPSWAAAAGIGGGSGNSGGDIIITGGNVKATVKSIYTSTVAPIGPGYKGTAGTLTDGTNNVTENIVIINGITSETAVTAITSEANVSYGLKDVYTTEDGELYLYWPDGVQLPSSITAGGATYYHNGDKTYGNHQHNWQYTAENAYTITANCIAEDCSNTNGGNVKITVADSVYTGSAIEASVTDTLATGDTYTVSYIANDGSELTGNKAVNVGKYTAKLAVGGESVSADFEITAKEITKDMVNISGDVLSYDGNAKTPAITVTANSSTLAEGTDYTVVYENNINATTETSKAKVTLEGTGNYTGTVSLNFDISKSEPEAKLFVFTPPTDLKYNGSAKQATVEVNDGVVGMGKVTVLYQKDGVNLTEAVNAGEYKVIISIQEGDNYTVYQGYLTNSDWKFTIEKADYDMSNVKWNYTAPFTFDKNIHTVELTGLPQDVSVNYSGNRTAVAGTHTAKATLSSNNENYNNPEIGDCRWQIVWDATEYTVSAPNDSGWLNQAFIITPVAGYKVSVSEPDIWLDSFTSADDTTGKTVTFRLKEDTTGSVSNPVTVSYKLDTAVPTGMVTVEENSWVEFLNNITFNLFFNKTVDVKVIAQDTLSDIKSVEYIESSEALTLDELKQIANWTKMDVDNNVSVTAEDAKQFVYYIRITDNADNVTYLSTNGTTFDTQSPVISGITDGTTYYTTQKFTVTETNLADVKVNDNAVTDYTLAGNVDTTYKVVATDKAGNSITINVTMKPISTLTDTIKNLTEADVTAENTADLAIAETALTAVDTTNATQAEKTEITAAQEKIDSLQQVIEEIKDSVDGAVAEEGYADKNADNVTSADKAAIEENLAEIKDILEDKADNLTDEQKTALETAKTEAEKLLKEIADNAQALEDASNSIPAVDTDNITDADIEKLEEAKEKLESILKDANYTAEEKEKVQNKLDEIKDIADEIGNTYVIIQGAGGKWTKGSSNTLGFTASGLFKLFKEVRVDGNILVKDTDYTAMNGSTIVTLSKSYLDTLSVGKHELEVVYDVLGKEHVAGCEFTIKVKSSSSKRPAPEPTPEPTDNVPKTGDTTNTVGWMVLMLSSLAALVVILIKKKE